MPLTVNPEKASFRLSGKDFEPADPFWAVATPREQLAWWKRVGELAVARLQYRLSRGEGVNGRKLPRIQGPRPDGAQGPPLSPHRMASRFRRYLRVFASVDGATVFWGNGWARIVGFHRAGAGHLPVRDVVGLKPADQEWVRTRARAERRGRFGVLVPPVPQATPAAPRAFTHPRVPTPPAVSVPTLVAPRARARAAQPRTAVATGRGGLAEGLTFTRPPGAEDGRRYAVVLADVARLEANLARDAGFHVGAGGAGAGIAGRYAEARRFLERARAAEIPVHMPRLTLADRRTGEVAITDGRHRFAVLRDSGATVLPVVVPRGEAERFRAIYGAALIRPRRRIARRASRPSP